MYPHHLISGMVAVDARKAQDRAPLARLRVDVQSATGRRWHSTRVLVRVSRSDQRC